MTGLHAALAGLADEWASMHLTGFCSNGCDYIGHGNRDRFVAEIRALLDEHPADLPVATDSTTAGAEGDVQHWMQREFDRAKRRNAQTPAHARMVVTNPDLSAHRRVETAAKKEGKHHPNCYQSMGEIPQDFPADICDCRVFNAIADANKTEPSDRAGLSESERSSLLDAVYGDDPARPSDPDDAVDAVFAAVKKIKRGLADRLAVVEQERETARDEVKHWKSHAEEAGEGFSRVCLDYARVSARNVELVDRAEAAEQKLAAVEALLPAECWISRTPDIRCIAYVGGAFPDGSPFAEDACCLPCRLRAALGDSAQVVQRIKDEERCPYVATDPVTTRRPRDDGWRCGHTAGSAHNHTLYSTDGEHILYAGAWILPDEATDA